MGTPNGTISSPGGGPYRLNQLRSSGWLYLATCHPIHRAGDAVCDKIYLLKVANGRIGPMDKVVFSRREFLQSTAGVAGASLAGSSLFLESESFAATAQTVAPSDRVRFGIV